MKLHPAGTYIISTLTTIVVIILIIINLIFPEQQWWHYVLYVSAIVFIFFVIRFFRRPQRKLDINDNLIYSAADGSVVAIEEIVEHEYFKDNRIQVSVFMSVLNAHVNWFPVSGKIVYRKHKPGKNYPAFVAKSSTDNERHSIVVRMDNGQEIMIRQIAGIMARRIVCAVKEGDEVKQGQEIGIIKFGSRVDLFLPPDAEIVAKLHHEVRGKRNIIARFPEK